MKELLRRPHLAGIGKGAEVPHQFCPVGRQGMEEVLKFFLDLRYASLHSGLSSFCPYSYAITGEHMQIDESVTSRVGAYGVEPPLAQPGAEHDCPAWGQRDQHILVVAIPMGREGEVIKERKRL